MKTLQAFVIGVLVASAVGVGAQQMPFGGFPGIPIPSVTAEPTVMFNFACFSETTQNTYIAQVASNDLGIYTGGAACVNGTLRFDVSSTAVTSALPILVSTVEPTSGNLNIGTTNGSALVLFTNNTNQWIVDGNGILTGTAAAKFAWGSSGTSSPDIFMRRSATKTLTIDADGAGGLLTLVQVQGSLSASANMNSPSINSTIGGSFYFQSGSVWRSVSDGISKFSNNAENTGFTMNTGTADTFTVKNFANNAFGNVSALAFQASGTPITSGTTHLSAGSGMNVANVGANSCGTSAASIAGNNNAWVITVGATAGTQCRVAFTVTAATEWDCASNDDTTTVAVRTTPVDTTHTDVVGAFTAGDKVSGICFPR